MTRFDVRAQAEPAALVRLLDLFAQRSMVPTAVNAHVITGELHATITLPDIGETMADNLCARMRNMIAVHSAVVLADDISVSIPPPSMRSAALLVAEA